jgi:DNA-binding winged helix-turn-helix (wHTH) protein/Tfp pilus assembly protein PilF/TolB-like protein
MSLPSVLAFDEFELRLDSGELFREGSLVTQLQPQPARLLELLASRSGEVVGREEIRQAVWGDSFVDFDASLNFCIKQLRRALDDSATSPRYIETLPRRGYRFLRPVQTRKAPTAEIALDETPVLAPASPPPGAKASWRLLTGLIATAAALVLLIVFLIASRFAPPPPPLHSRLAVFPLACQGGHPVDQQICGGVTKDLMAEITRQFPQDLEVIAPTATLIYRWSGKSPQDIGKNLGATHFLTGTVETSSGRFRITARLATTAGKDLWRDGFDGDLMDAQGVYEQIARQVAKTLKLQLPVASPISARPSREASEAYLRGVYLRHEWSLEDAKKSLEEATLLDPQYAPAFAQLALARVYLHTSPQEDAPASRAAAQRALQLDPGLPEAHLAMADVLFEDLVDWEGAGAEYRRALLLSPGNAEILHDYGMYLIALGRFDEGLEYAKKARELDPDLSWISSDYAWFLFMARHDDEAIQQARLTLTLIKMTQPIPVPIATFGRIWSYHVLLFASLKKGDERTALNSGLERLRVFGHGAATARLRSVHDLLEWQYRYVAGLAHDHPGISYTLAQTAAASGRTGEALDALEQACRNGGEGMLFNFVAVEPAFDPLHKDPRFAKIVDCTRLPKDAPARLTLQTAGPVSSAAPPISKEAMRAYLEGQYFTARAEHDKAQDSFQKAADLAPRYAPAWAALVHELLEDQRPARELEPILEAAERQALALDPALALAHLDRAERLFRYEHAWDKAEREYLSALKLDPQSGEAHCDYAMLLAARGRHDEALKQVEQARYLEPDRQLARARYPWIYFLARRYDEAIQQARDQIALAPGKTSETAKDQPELFWAYRTLTLAALAKGDRDTALEGARGEARWLGDPEPATLDEHWRYKERHFAQTGTPRPWFRVVPAIELGEREHALDLLLQQCRDRSDSMIAFLRVDPLYDSLRSDPRFRDLLRCASLAEAPG